VNVNTVNLFGQYDLEILRTWKGRGSYVCETPQGLFILKEYMGHVDKVAFQDRVLRQIREAGFEGAEQILPDREGNLLVKDQDGTSFVCKTYVEGRECDIRSREEVQYLTEVLAKLHRVMMLPREEACIQPLPTLSEEFEKRDRELRKARKFLKGRGQKTDFELFLYQNYELFFHQAMEVSEACARAAKQNLQEKEPEALVAVCHGDVQHHNLILKERDVHILNFERCGVGSQMRDLYRFMRKFFEKNGWSVAAGRQIVEHYQKEKPMSHEDFEQLYFRFAYPEKFWKIVNFYFNKGKSWMPGRNGEKLQALLSQEEDKQRFLQEFERYL